MKIYNLEIKDEVKEFTKKLFYTLFLEQIDQEKSLNKLRINFLKITNALSITKGEKKWEEFISQFDYLRQKAELDALSIEKNDPAAKSLEEVILAYPGFQAITIYRMSNILYKMKIPTLPRIMTEYAHSVTGTDIHPGATIGDSFFIDHATGVVIGETTIIKNNVKLYQGVTLGAFHIEKSLSNIKRHPTIEDNVIIYANASILGGETIIGKNSTISANVWITESVPENSLVIHQSNNIIKTKRNAKII